jgi:SAM-dependent methyltransferase
VSLNAWFLLRDWLLSRLQYAELRGIPIDSPETTLRRRALLERNMCARFSFESWYRELGAAALTAPPGRQVELGSGGGFLDQFIPGLIKTDVVELPFIHTVCFAENLPFSDNSVSVLVMINTLHHVSDVDSFFREAVRVLVPGGLIAMVEPYVSSFSRLVYHYIHHEPFNPDVTDWRLPSGGRLSSGNDALPWVVFVRDRARFEREHPRLRIITLRPHTPLSHLLSGGVTTRPLAPLWAVRNLAKVENTIPWAMRWVALFFTVILRSSD